MLVAEDKIQYEKPHHADWAKTLDGRIAAGGMWKSPKQYDFFARLASVQPGSAKDELTRDLHKKARKYLSGVKPSHRLLITRFTLTTGAVAYPKVSVYEFDQDGLIRKWRVSVAPGTGGEGELPTYRWTTAEVAFQRSGWRDEKKDHMVLPKSSLTDKQIPMIAKALARKHKINTMSDEQLRSVVMQSIVNNAGAMIIDYKKAILYRLGKNPRAPQNQEAWDQVISQDVERIISAIPDAVDAEDPDAPDEMTQDEFNEKYKNHLAFLGIKKQELGTAAYLKYANQGIDPYESRQANLRLKGTTIAAISVELSEDGNRTFTLERRSGEVFRYESQKGEFKGFERHLIEECGSEQARKAILALREESKRVMRS